MKFIVQITSPQFDVLTPKEDIQKAFDAAAAAGMLSIERHLRARIQNFEKLHAKAKQLLEEAKALCEKDISVEVQITPNDRFSASLPPVRVAKPRAQPDANGELPGGLRRMLVALAQRDQLSKRQLGVRAGLSSTSGTFGTYLGKLRANGYVEGQDMLSLTEAGRAALGNYDPLPEGRDLLNYWLGQLGGGGAGRMLSVLAEVYPQALTKQELGERAQISHTSGTFGTYLGKLRTLELVEGRGELSASREFFE